MIDFMVFKLYNFNFHTLCFRWRWEDMYFSFLLYFRVVLHFLCGKRYLKPKIRQLKKFPRCLDKFLISKLCFFNGLLFNAQTEMLFYLDVNNF